VLTGVGIPTRARGGSHVHRVGESMVSESSLHGGIERDGI
jgi:hypothetical protein